MFYACGDATGFYAHVYCFGGVALKTYVNMCVCTYMDACCLECCCCCLSMSVYVHVYIYICVASVYRSFACVVILLLYFNVSYAYTGACMCTTYIYI